MLIEMMMKFRYARHTNNLDVLVNFYQDIIGLNKLGEFTQHNGYNGVFLGFKGQNWHLEFTCSIDEPNQQPDKDDLIVFYLDSEEQIQTILDNASKAGVIPAISQNPYWNENGIELTDPDGFGVIITTKQVNL